MYKNITVRKVDNGYITVDKLGNSGVRAEVERIHLTFADLVNDLAFRFNERKVGETISIRKHDGEGSQR